MTELVRKQASALGGTSPAGPTAGTSPFLASRSSPMAIPGSGPAAKQHMEVSSWRGGSAGGNSGAFDFRRNTPDRGTPPLEGFMQMRKRGTPNMHPSPYNGGGGGGSVNNSFSSKRQTEEKVDQQPGLVVHGTVSAADAAAGVKSATLVAPVLKLLKEAGVAYGHYFFVPPHKLASVTSPSSKGQPDKIADDELCLDFSLDPSLSVGEEDFRASVVVHCSTWLDAESGIAKLRNTPLPYTHTATALEAPKETVHCTLVLKNLPFGLKHEALMEDLIRMACRPTYIRYYHDERGTFKGIAFVKYASHQEAEIRVEFKHKQGGRADNHGRGVSLEQAALDSRSPTQSPAGPSPSTKTPQEHIVYTPYDDDSTPDAHEIELEEMILDFLKSDDRDMAVPKAHPAHVHIRKLCYRHHLRWDHQREATLCKKTPSTPSLGAHQPRGTPSSRPMWASTPPCGPISNTSFGMREKPNKLAIMAEQVILTKGPAESERAFPPGRGKPLPPPTPK